MTDHFVIHKYRIAGSGDYFEVPQGSRLLSIQEQNRQLTAWVEKPLNQPYDPQRFSFQVIGTGRDVGTADMEGYTYFTTVVMTNGLVWHVYVKESYPLNG